MSMPSSRRPAIFRSGLRLASPAPTGRLCWAKRLGCPTEVTVDVPWDAAVVDAPQRKHANCLLAAEICHRIYSRHRQGAKIQAPAVGAAVRRNSVPLVWFGTEPSFLPGAAGPHRSGPNFRSASGKGLVRNRTTAFHVASAERALAGCPGAARKLRRRGAHLLVQVEVVRAAARIGRTRSTPAGGRPTSCAARARLLLAGVPLSLPCDQRAARCSSGAAYSTSVASGATARASTASYRSRPFAARPVLGARFATARAPGRARGRRRQELALAAHGLDQVDTASRAARSRAGGPEIRRRCRCRRLARPARPRRSSNGSARGCPRRARRRPRQGRAPMSPREGRRARGPAARPAPAHRESERPLARRPLRAAAPPLPSDRVSRFTRSRGRSGVITIRRKGSSPSECVSTSGRSFR